MKSFVIARVASIAVAWSLATVSPCAGLRWPLVTQTVVGSFGDDRGGRFLDGIELQATKGDVRPIDDGEIVFGQSDDDPWTLPSGTGSFIVVEHRSGLRSIYGGLSPFPPLTGSAAVIESRTLGTVDGSGRFYLGVVDRLKRRIVNPVLVLPPRRRIPASISSRRFWYEVLSRIDGADKSFIHDAYALDPARGAYDLVATEPTDLDRVSSILLAAEFANPPVIDGVFLSHEEDVVEVKESMSSGWRSAAVFVKSRVLPESAAGFPGMMPYRIAIELNGSSVFSVLFDYLEISGTTLTVSGYLVQPIPPRKKTGSVNPLEPYLTGRVRFDPASLIGDDGMIRAGDLEFADGDNRLVVVSEAYPGERTVFESAIGYVK